MDTELQTNEAVQTETKSKKRRGTWILILLVIFLILFLLTTAILGARLYEMTVRERYTVDLVLGEPKGEIELFRIEHENELGEITVHGVNADNVVAPGTTVDYDFRLRNKDDVIIDFVMAPTVEFFSEHVVPIQFRIVDTYGNYILGSETEWSTAEDMNALAHKGSIHPDEVFTYHISWRWIFEGGAEQDAYDTYLGNLNGELPPGVRVSLEVQAAANPAPVKDRSHRMHLLGEGFGCCWCCWLVWFLLLVVVLLLVWVWRLRRKLSKLEETMEEYEETMKQFGAAEFEEALKQRGVGADL